MPHRIAMVVASPFPADHGTPGSIREMAEALAKSGHHVHIVTYHFGVGTLPKGVAIHRLPDLGFGRHMVVGPTWQKPLLDGLMVFILCRVIRQESLELIHAHNYEGGLIGALASLCTRRPLVYHAVNTMRDELPTYNFLKPAILATSLARFLDYWVPRLADRIIALSEDLARFLLAQGIRPECLQVIPPGIDTRHFHGRNPAIMRQRYHVTQEKLVVYTGILDRFQRIDYLLEAMCLVVKHIADARLLLVVNLAKPRDLQACHMMLEALGLQGHVDIVALATFEELPLFLAAADVTVVCRPQCPGFPIKLLNYMAAGKAIVVSEGSAKGLRHMQQAFVVQDHDSRSLGQGILTLMQDPILAETLGRNAQHWVETHHAWPTLVPRIENVYTAALNRA